MKIQFDGYVARVTDNGIEVYVGTRRYAILKPGWAVDTPDRQDVDLSITGPEEARYEDGVELTWRASSNVWPEKTYVWRFEPSLFWCEVKVKGDGAIKEVRPLDNASENMYGWSFFDFSRYMNPDCALLDQRYYKSMQYGCIDCSSGQMSDVPRDPLADCHWIFTPPPFCYSLGFSSGPWLAAGLAPQPGCYGFTRFEYVPGHNSFCFRLTYEGETSVKGSWTSPKLVFIPAEDEYDAIARHCDQLRTWQLVAENTHQRAAWWSRPIFCGWGEQNVNSIRMKGVPSNTLARQEMYDKFLSIIEEKGLKPGTIVIDDKWQSHYGTFEADRNKWPDLRGWIDARHAEDRHVLLWFGAWDAEGLSDDEVIFDPDGNRACADPTSPAYQARIREMMHRMLSDDPGCYNADGIKYDWTNGIPLRPGYTLHGDAWGLELLKSLTQQIYDAAKAAKPDALVITHTANPYFAECTDMLRLNDIYVGCREIASMMAHRQKIARLACPHALIDCDNSSAPNHTEWLEFTLSQPELGVPSLYFLTGFDGTMEEITDEDWEKLGHIWRAD